jgi:GT2 family glycosyltransferase
MISILIPTYNNLFFTQQIIGLIQQTTKCDYEIVIVDNGSVEPGMQEYFNWLEQGAKNMFGEIKIIRNGENLGVAKAWNIGIKSSAGEIIAILNNDILIGNDCIERMVKVLDENPDIWCLSPAFTCLSMPKNWHELELKQRFVPQQIVSGGKGFFFMFRRDVMDKLEKPKEGLFIDEQFGMLWYEDTDLWERFKKVGHPAMSVSNILIHHFESKTIALIDNANKYKAENREKFLNKYNIKQDESKN